ncbi:MAG: hypothetical protein MI919_05415, partial [Holophagales bacterium]|nr:hypothetical protein [Holophagales bacterium]
VYRELFLDQGRHVSTFDRQTLAETISAELRPEVRGDGRVVQKSVDRTVEDLRTALLGLGRRRLRPAIFGGEGQSGLDLGRGLELEARLVLETDGGRRDEPAVAAYVEKKMRALSQQAGVLARVDASDARALDDGVVVNRTRQLIVGLDRRSEQASRAFVQKLESLLELGGYQVKTDNWHDPRIAIVHDVVLPIPLYYVQPVVAEIEEAYLRLAADEKRPYHLHTDFNWEKTLPNLNPRRSEVAVDWSLRMLAEGLLMKVVAFHDGHWRWRLAEGEAARELGENLSSALYRLGEIHRSDDLRRRFRERIDASRARLGDGAEAERRDKLRALIDRQIEQISLRELDGALSPHDVLDRPVLRALLDLVDQGELGVAAASTVAEAGAATSYAGWSFDE